MTQSIRVICDKCQKKIEYEPETVRWEVLIFCHRWEDMTAGVRGRGDRKPRRIDLCEPCAANDRLGPFLTTEALEDLKREPS